MFETLSKPYVIAEIGQNHQGSITEAIKYINIYSSLGASAVKFQIRDNKVLFDDSIYNEVYNSENSFGHTYGEHREALELEKKDFINLKKCCKDNNVDLIITPFDSPSLDFCVDLKVDALKVASFDLGNLPFLEKIAITNLPIVMSTGGGSFDQICSSTNTVLSFNKDLVLLHCVSHYPCPPDKVRLGRIPELKKQFPDVTIGISDHFNGILTGPLAYLMGAMVFEKHVTFDRSLKGTDHPFSLEPDGFRRFVRDISRAKIMVSNNEPPDLGSEPVFKKLGKSLIASCLIKKDTIITNNHLDGKIYRPTIIPVRNSSNVIGKKTIRDILPGQPITLESIY